MYGGGYSGLGGMGSSYGGQGGMNSMSGYSTLGRNLSNFNIHTGTPLNQNPNNPKGQPEDPERNNRTSHYIQARLFLKNGLR